MDKKISGASRLLARFRGWIQAGAALLTNIHLPNFLKGKLYQGAGKTVCVPGLNCYSCPAASGACPIGAFQAVVGSSKFSFSYYITGFLILLGVLLGRFICGFLCPFGWLQELLHKIPTKKFSTKKLKPLTYLKYAVLLVMVVLLPVLVVNDVGMGNPFFCKYLCPQGVLEGAIPLSLANAGIRAALGKLFTWKLGILLTVIALSMALLFLTPIVLTITNSFMTQDEITAAEAFMQKVCTQDVYWEGIRKANSDKNAITGDLWSFIEIVPNGDGYKFIRTEENAKGVGVKADQIDGWYDSQMYRAFRSSQPDIVAHENLLVTKPQYNTEVTIDSVLSYTEYAKYWEKFKDNEAYAQFAKFYKQPIFLTVKVAGSTGVDDPNAGTAVTADVKIIGY